MNIKIVIILLMSILSLYFNSLGLIGILPIIATAIYTLLMDITDIVKFKILSISTTALWVIYNLYIMAYAPAIVEVLQILANIIAIYRVKKLKLYKTK